MKKLLALFKKKDGVALATAVSFMAVAVALCGVISTFVVLMSKTSAKYVSVNENKIIADQIAEDYMSYVSTDTDNLKSAYNKFSNSSTGSAYAGYISEEGYDSGSNYFYCETTLINIKIDASGSDLKYTKYEYRNI